MKKDKYSTVQIVQMTNGQNQKFPCMLFHVFCRYALFGRRRHLEFSQPVTWKCINKKFSLLLSRFRKRNFAGTSDQPGFIRSRW